MLFNTAKINHDIFINYTSFTSTPVTPLKYLTIELDTHLSLVHLVMDNLPVKVQLVVMCVCMQ